LLVLNVKYALVRFRPCTVKALNSLLSFQFRVHTTDVEVIARIRCHHVRRKNFFVAPGYFQKAVPRIRLQKKPMPWVRRGCEALFDAGVQLRNIVLRHCNLPTIAVVPRPLARQGGAKYELLIAILRRFLDAMPGAI
jgi:hypothetical protein